MTLESASVTISDCDVKQAICYKNNRSLFDLSEFEAKYDELFTRSKANCIVLLLFVDADNLKQTNDTLGHFVGDQLIAEIGQILADGLPRTAAVCRKGGDEFIACVAAKDLQAAEDIAIGIGYLLNTRCQIGSHELLLSCSVGAAIIDSHSPDLKNHLKQADIAMYRAKNSGKAQMRFYDEEDSAEFLAKQELFIEFPIALKSGALSFCCQPIYHVASRTIIGAEALIRWNSPRHGNVSAQAIVSIASRCGRMLDLGLFILREACNAALHWPTDKFLSINFCASDFASTRFAALVLEVVRDVGFEATRLKIEITESEKLATHAVVRKNMKELKLQGVTIGVDDFGAGHASMAAIDSFPFDFVKIDRSLITNCNQRTSSKIFVNAIKKVSENLSLDVIAEGVETLAEAAVVRGIGIKYAQGFYFKRPISPFSMLELFETPTQDYYNRQAIDKA